MQILKDNREQPKDKFYTNELFSRLFPEQAELERLNSLKETKSAGEIRAESTIHQLFAGSRGN